MRFNPTSPRYIMPLPENAPIYFEPHDDLIEMPDHRLFYAHAVLCQVWSRKGMECQYQKLASFFSMRQFVADGCMEVPTCITS